MFLVSRRHHSFESRFPIIDSDGDISTIKEDFEFWILLGNTCDLERNISDIEFSHIAPLKELNSNTPQKISNILKLTTAIKDLYS